MHRLRILGTVVQAMLDDVAQHRFIFPKIVAGRGLDVWVPGQILDVGNVGSVMEEVCTKGVAE